MKATKRCPEDFVITEEMRRWAAVKTPGVDIDEETEMFCDHEFRNGHKDWLATWRNWMRREQKQINRQQSNRAFYAGQIERPKTVEQNKKEITYLAEINGVQQGAASWDVFRENVLAANQERIARLQ